MEATVIFMMHIFTCTKMWKMLGFLMVEQTRFLITFPPFWMQDTGWFMAKLESTLWAKACMTVVCDLDQRISPVSIRRQTE
mmetsp:Transcript_33208/g.87297  ORF Transcript_33208/g.87297 Transcript_33208/m.87297 type:complete len:81 (-) Transcript_33208:802-1044(-)